MLRTVRTAWVVGGALVILATLAAGTSSAGLITSISGEYQGIDPVTSNQPTSSSFTFVAPDTAQFNPSGLSDLHPSDLNVNLTPFPSSTAATSGPVTLSSLLTVSDDNGHTATFKLSNGKLTINGNSDTISATATYVSDNFGSLADLSAFKFPGTGIFTATLQGIQVNPPPEEIHVQPFDDTGGVASWDNDPNSPGFSAVIGTFEIIPNQVPEPASLALWGAAVAMGAAWLRRRQQCKKLLV